RPRRRPGRFAHVRLGTRTGRPRPRPAEPQGGGRPAARGGYDRTQPGPPPLQPGAGRPAPRAPRGRPEPRAAGRTGAGTTTTWRGQAHVSVLDEILDGVRED